MAQPSFEPTPQGDTKSVNLYGDREPDNITPLPTPSPGMDMVPPPRGGDGDGTDER